MEQYVIVEVKDLDGEALGYAVHREGTKKLEDTNLWTEDESKDLQDHVADLNNRLELQAHWPDARDPEVQELIDDENFEPLQYTQQALVNEHTGQEEVIETLVDPAAPMDRYRKAAETVAKRRVGVRV